MATSLGLIVISNRGIAVPWFSGIGAAAASLILLVGGAGRVGGRPLARPVSNRTGAPRAVGAVGRSPRSSSSWSPVGCSAATRGRVPDARRPRARTGGIRVDPSYFALLFALVIYTASHIAEIVRGSIQAVPLGQGEAADALALSGFQRLWFVVLPQALRIAIPPIGNQYLNLIKNSSLGAAIGYYDLTLVTQTTVGNGSPAVPAFALTMLIYIVLSLVTSFFVNLANRRMALVER